MEIKGARINNYMSDIQKMHTDINEYLSELNWEHSDLISLVAYLTNEPNAREQLRGLYKTYINCRQNGESELTVLAAFVIMLLGTLREAEGAFTEK